MVGNDNTDGAVIVLSNEIEAEINSFVNHLVILNGNDVSDESIDLMSIVTASLLFSNEIRLEDKIDKM